MARQHGKEANAVRMQGVKEYFIFDPRVEFLEAAVMGWRLHDKRYREVAADEQGRWKSEMLGLWLEPRELLLRLWDPETVALVPLPNELVAAAEERAAAAEERVETAEERIRAAERLTRVNQRVRRQADRQVEQERERADQLAQELARLRQLLRDQQPPEAT